MRQRNYTLSLSEGEGRGEGDMEIPPHPAPGRLGIRLANPPHPSPPDGGEGTKAVITGSVNSSELTLFDPVIHASRWAVHVDGRVADCPPAGEAGPVGPAMTQSFFASQAHPLTQLRLWLAGSPSLRIPLPLTGAREPDAATRLLPLPLRGRGLG